MKFYLDEIIYTKISGNYNYSKIEISANYYIWPHWSWVCLITTRCGNTIPPAWHTMFGGRSPACSQSCKIVRLPASRIGFVSAAWVYKWKTKQWSYHFCHFKCRFHWLILTVHTLGECIALWGKCERVEWCTSASQYYYLAYILFFPASNIRFHRQIICLWNWRQEIPEEVANFQMHAGVHGGVQLGHVFTLAAFNLVHIYMSLLWMVVTAAGNKISNTWRVTSFWWEFTMPMLEWAVIVLFTAVSSSV